MQDVCVPDERQMRGIADMRRQKAQSQISDVIEPTAEKLIPIADELKDVYRQIDLLEVSPISYPTPEPARS